MPPDRDRLEELFHAALDLPPAEREAFVERESGGDAGLAAELASLLAAADDAETDAPGFLETPAHQGFDELDPSLEGKRFGRYRIVRRIASGGMGSVFEAEQDEPRRTVALKVLRAASLDERALERFRVEADVLGRLRHPNVAQVFEAGVSRVDRAAPWIAMEYVSGARDLLEYARAADLGLERRLELFLAVCAAVHHGHQKGVIHRDLKPSNVLVDDEGRVRVIDFGVARVVDEERHAMLTGHGELVGTLQYMSPEQCAGDPDLVDVRTDVHALGLLLYELLCGRRPYEVAGLPLTEAVQAVVQREPTRPTRANPDLPRDLEAVIRKALEKDPDRRYASVAGLSDDLRRFLRREPVEASPPGPLHALLLFARRRPAVVFGAVVLAVSAAVSAGFAASARRARDRAEADANMRGQMLELVLDLFERARPNVAQGEEPKVADLFDGVLERIDERLAGQTRAQLQLLATIAKLQQEQYRHAASLPLLDRALELQREHRALRESEDAYLLRLRARAKLETGDLDGALADIREAMATFRRTLPADDPRRFQYAIDHANIRSQRGELDEAERLLTEVADDASVERIDAALALANLGVVHYKRGDFARAESVLRTATGHLRRQDGGATVELSRTLNVLALTLKMQGRLDEARPIYEESLEAYARLVPDDHRTLATFELNLAALLQAADDVDAASAHLDRSSEHVAAADDAVLSLEVRRQQIAVARKRDLPSEAVRRAREAIATVEATPAIPPVAAAEFHVHLGEALLAAGDAAEGTAALERAVAMGEDRPDLRPVVERARALLEFARSRGDEEDADGDGGDD